MENRCSINIIKECLKGQHVGISVNKLSISLPLLMLSFRSRKMPLSLWHLKYYPFWPDIIFFFSYQAFSHYSSKLIYLLPLLLLFLFIPWLQYTSWSVCLIVPNASIFQPQQTENLFCLSSSILTPPAYGSELVRSQKLTNTFTEISAITSWYPMSYVMLSKL